MECLSVRDDDGHFNPLYGECVLPQEIEAQTVILAIGQTADPALVPEGLRDRRARPHSRGRSDRAAATVWSTTSSRPETRSPDPRRWSRHWRRERGQPLASIAISRAKRCTGTGRTPTVRPPSPPRRTCRLSTASSGGRCRRRARHASFQETVLPLDWRGARMEAERCLTCGSRSVIAYLDDCQVCRLCQHHCPTEAIEVTEGALLGSLHGWDVVILGR